MSTPKLNGIDHIHLYVNDKNKAAAWYREVLGFEIHQPFEVWNNENGPMTLEDSSGTIHLALFTRSNQPPLTSIAFNADGKEFLQWTEHLKSQGLKLRIADHRISWSMYFKDPDENMHEITTMDYEWVSERMTR